MKKNEVHKDLRRDEIRELGLIFTAIFLVSVILIYIQYKNTPNVRHTIKAPERLTHIEAVERYFPYDAPPQIPLRRFHLPKATTDILETQSSKNVNYDDITYLAKTVYGEARGCSRYEQSLVVWCILNRVDHGGWYGYDIPSVVTKPSQFFGYDESFPVTKDIYELCEEVYHDWLNGGANRTLPKEYLSFTGDGEHNWFTNESGDIYEYSAGM